MKKVAFFIALMVGLSATPAVRKPEEEEGQAVVLRDEDTGTNKNRTSVIHHITNSLMTCFYAITRDGKLDLISWDRISRIFSQQNTDNKKDNTHLNSNGATWLLMNYESDGRKESIEYFVLEKNSTLI